MLAEAPPTSGLFSTIATRLPNIDAAAAALSPAGPDPITIKSYVVGSMVLKIIPQAGPPAKWVNRELPWPIVDAKSRSW